ncbi:hypothetical protein ACFR9U_06425 [Halorientalis brevis]|uniref:Uncharacterized protein n=1 Tax=Halorientalis brevis TaxID=1126241 RepID=A0ABD6C8W4_9EURY|nr:hypothetical protein [Halorientalis brevis]
MTAAPLLDGVSPVDAESAIFAITLVTATVGAFVAYQAFRGYLRNASQPMLYLAVGIALLTVVPFLVTRGLRLAVTLTDAQFLLLVTAFDIAGLSAILYSLTRA